MVDTTTVARAVRCRTGCSRPGFFLPHRWLTLLVGVATVATLSMSCSRDSKSERWSSSETEGFIAIRSISLTEDTPVRGVLQASNKLIIVEGYPNRAVSTWSLTGESLGLLAASGRAPGQILVPAESVLLGDVQDVVGIIDTKSYRVSFFDVGSLRFLRSFLVSPYELMVTGGASDPQRDRLYLFSPSGPELSVFDYSGQLLAREDHVDDAYTSSYASFFGTCVENGDLVYSPQVHYALTRRDFSGRVSAFSGARGASYVPALPIPEPIAADLSSPEREGWEKSVSWITKIEHVGGLILVCYSIPPGLERFHVDVFSDDGEPLALDTPVPGRLVGCNSEGACWFHSAEDQKLRLMRIRQ